MNLWRTTQKVRHEDGELEQKWQQAQNIDAIRHIKHPLTFCIKRSRRSRRVGTTVERHGEKVTKFAGKLLLGRCVSFFCCTSPTLGLGFFFLVSLLCTTTFYYQSQHTSFFLFTLLYYYSPFFSYIKNNFFFHTFQIFQSFDP